MALTTFVQKLINQISSDSKAEWRTAGGNYVDTQRQLALGAELDSKQVVEVLKAAGISEQQFEEDAETMAKRIEWTAQRAQHQQAMVDHQKAAADMQAAQRELQQAIDRLTPAVLSAEARMRHAEHIALVTASAESNLMADENIIDRELLVRERAVTQRLREIVPELNPLKTDLGHKLDSLRSAEAELQRIKARDPGNVFSGVGAWFGQVLPDQKPAQRRIDDLRNQIAQLSAAIEPRQAELDKLTKELNAIHAEKLKP